MTWIFLFFIRICWNICKLFYSLQWVYISYTVNELFSVTSYRQPKAKTHFCLFIWLLHLMRNCPDPLSFLNLLSIYMHVTHVTTLIAYTFWPSILSLQIQFALEHWHNIYSWIKKCIIFNFLLHCNLFVKRFYKWGSKTRFFFLQ